VRLFLVMMATVPAVPTVHEEMHQRACQDEQERQNTEQMCPVFRQQEEQADEEEPGRYQARFGFPEARPRTAALVFVLSMIE
jgi:hypothetical protein